MPTDEMSKNGVTFGANSTAQSRGNRQHTELVGLLRTIENAEMQIEELQQRCCHHFVAPAECTLNETLVRGVFVAGTIGARGKSSNAVEFWCPKCDKRCPAHFSDRCPRCAGKVVGEQSDEKASTYFSEPASDWLWLGECSVCNTRFAALIQS